MPWRGRRSSYFARRATKAASGVMVGPPVGKGVFMASRVSVIPNVSIGDNAYLGAGTVVLRDVPAGWKMVGNPARRIA